MITEHCGKPLYKIKDLALIFGTYICIACLSVLFSAPHHFTLCDGPLSLAHEKVEPLFFAFSFSRDGKKIPSPCSFPFFLPLFHLFTPLFF